MTEITHSQKSSPEAVTAFNMTPQAEHGLQELAVQLDVYQKELINSFNISPEIEDALQELSLLLDIYDGTFTLLLARCNYANLRDRAIARLTEISDTKIHQVCLDRTTRSIYHTIQASQPTTSEGNLPAVMVTGLEVTDNVDTLVKGLNQIREEFRKHCPYPIVLWINDDVLKMLIKTAPDFESWTTTIELAISSDDLIKSLTAGTEALFDLAIKDNLIDPSYSLGQISHLGGIYLSELANAPTSVHWLYGLYLCYLAEAQIQLGDRADALTNLLEAKRREHCGHPHMYIRILNRLCELYFAHGQYLEAFHIKQERLAIEQRYGYRAFIGAGQLQSCLEEKSSFADKAKIIISPEIYASGRKQDQVGMIRDRLIESFLSILRLKQFKTKAFE